MNVRNCRKCGRLFNYVMGPITCPQCREALEAKFKEVKTYIQSHPGCGISEVSEACEVEVGQIQQWLREERLQFAEGSAIELFCEGCGKPIRSGRYCDTCKAEMTNGFGQMLKPKTAPKAEPRKDPREAARMRFIDTK